MFINEIELQNIRGYSNQKIKFSEGISLLSGDIGSGKSTILLALEYALFGIIRGKTSASELLKHGSKDGFVKLKCEIQGKEITIQRNLKRTRTNIVQKEGCISINGNKEALTPVELKAKILGLLGYPESMLNTSSNLFRYTVYTPQEQVKQILFESADERKDIIRKIFDIDKYNRILENINHYKSRLRELIANLEGQTNDVKIIQEQLSAQRNEKEKIESILPNKSKEWEIIKKKYFEINNEQLEKQKELIIFSQEKNTIEKLKKRIVEEENRLKQIKEDIKKNTNITNKKLTEVKKPDSEKKKKIEEHFKKLFEARTKLLKQLGELDARKNSSDKLVKSITSLNTCPTCRQDVSDEHKNRIRKEQEEELEKINTKKEKIDSMLKQLEDKERILNDNKNKLQREEQEFTIYLKEKEHIDRNIKEKEILLERQTKQELLITELKKQRSELESKFSEEKLMVLEDALKKITEKKQRIEKEERIINNEITSIRTKLKIASNMLSQLENSLEEKNKLLHRLKELKVSKEWIETTFIPLLKKTESRVLSKVHFEFNEFFIKLFNILIDDDSFVVRLDNEFSPRIEQNGFDTSVNNLSGGEKTALAIAYRLALNKVLNNYFGSLHTKELIVLDEPTEGFSTEQIDRLREVITKLNMKQLIIVSHEQKLESLADHIFRVEKTNNYSIIEQ